MPTIGVLALQGAFLEHINMFNIMGVTALEVRNMADLNRVDGLVIPGGESTTIGMQLKQAGMIQPIQKLIQQGMPIWGTCAGLILLSNRVNNEKSDSQELLGGLPINTVRNYYGRQNESFIGEIQVNDSNENMQQIFIRAPFIENTDPEVEVLATLSRDKTINPVAIKYKNLFATTFHPELSTDRYWHQQFIRM